MGHNVKCNFATVHAISEGNRQTYTFESSCAKYCPYLLQIKKFLKFHGNEMTTKGENEYQYTKSQINGNGTHKRSRKYQYLYRPHICVSSAASCEMESSGVEDKESILKVKYATNFKILVLLVWPKALIKWDIYHWNNHNVIKSDEIRVTKKII